MRKKRCESGTNRQHQPKRRRTDATDKDFAHQDFTFILEVFYSLLRFFNFSQQDLLFIDFQSFKN
jgi:hypothetical protein